MGDSGKGFKFECWRVCSSLRFSFLELCPAMDHRLGALGLLGSSGGLFCCENCYSAFWDSVGDSRKVSSYPRPTSVLQQLLIHRVEMSSTRLYMIFLVGSQTNPRLSQRP